MKDFISYVAPALGMLLIIYAGFAAYSWIGCGPKSIGFEDHKWGVFTGCMVVHKNMWIPLDNVRGFD